MKSVIPPFIAAIATAMALAACDSGGQPAAGDGAIADANTILPAEPDMVPADAMANGTSPTAPQAARLPTDAWIGKWVGVEGLVLDIAPGADAGHYALKVTLLDGTDDYAGVAAGDSIRFKRNGREESIRKASGDETGLKYLAGKKNCLMIRDGEGFCRD